MAGPNATTPEVLPYDAKAQAAWLRAFRAEARKDADKLSAQQRARLDLLDADLGWMQRVEDRGRGKDRTFLLAIFSGFETLWGDAAGFWCGAARMLRGIGPWIWEAMAPAQVAAPLPPGDFARDHALFDRLSTHYGGQYRGGIVFSYRLAILVVLLALLSRLAHELGLDHHWPSAAVSLGVTEYFVVGAIMLLFLIGYTPKRGARARGWRRYVGRGWRQRWLEYRLLAERFRFAELLRVTDLPLADAWRRLLASHPGAHWLERHGRTPGELWHERLFLARIAEVPKRKASNDFADEFKGLLAEQHAYHQGVKERRGRIAHRLHTLATWSFIIALVLSLVHVPLLSKDVLKWIEHTFQWSPETVHLVKGLIVLGAGILTGIAAAVHGTLATSEYAKLAEISDEMVRELDVLTQLVSEKRASNANMAALAPEVEAFCRLATEDASGWSLLLRDKDLPRGGH